MKKVKENFVNDDMQHLDELTAVPNILMDKYQGIFDKSQTKAIFEIIRETYRAGLDLGRNESPIFAVIPISILENRTLSANSKLLYAEVMALTKRSGKCYATNEHLANMLGLSKRTIPDLLKELQGNGLIIVDVQRSNEGTYRNITVSFFSEGGIRQRARGGYAKERGHNRNRQKEIDKELNTPAPSAAVKDNIQNQIAELFDIFKKSINPTINFGHTTQRRAAQELIEKFGYEKATNTAKYAVSIQGQKFAPTITTPYLLQTKLAELLIYYKKQQKSNILSI